MSLGRPSKYKDAYCEKVRKHLSGGFTVTSFAGTIDVSRDTIYEWASKHSNFSDAIKVGRAQGLLIWEKRLASQAIDGGGNTASIIFAMKNLYVEDWSDKQSLEHSGPDGQAIEISDTSSADKLTALLDRMAPVEDDAESG